MEYTINRERLAQTSNMKYTNIPEVATRERLAQTNNMEYRNILWIPTRTPSSKPYSIRGVDNRQHATRGGVYHKKLAVAYTTGNAPWRRQQARRRGVDNRQQATCRGVDNRQHAMCCVVDNTQHAA